MPSKYRKWIYDWRLKATAPEEAFDPKPDLEVLKWNLTLEDTNIWTDEGLKKKKNASIRLQIFYHKGHQTSAGINS